MNGPVSIGVVGAGSWGTALACILAQKGLPVWLWGNEAEQVSRLRHERRNAQFLPDIPFPPSLDTTDDLAGALAHDAVVLAVPSQAMREVAARIAPHLTHRPLIVCATKGIDLASNQLMSEVLEAALPEAVHERLTYLSGPSFAGETAAGHPTAVVIASRHADAAADAQTLFRTPTFLTFTHHDVVGVELGGAIKNVLAIAAGLVDGMGFGHNTRAALITRGLYEMIKIGTALGAEPLTFAGLAGIGDLILTCTGAQSRNRRVGEGLGRGFALKQILERLGMVAEGVPTAKALHTLISKHAISAPICTAVYQMLYEDKAPAQALAELTSMELHGEHTGLRGLLKSTL